MAKYSRLGAVAAALASVIAAVGVPAARAVGRPSSVPLAAIAATGKGATIVSWSPASTGDNGPSRSPSASPGGPAQCPAPWTTVVSGSDALAKLVRACAHVPYIAHFVDRSSVANGGPSYPGGDSSSGHAAATPTYYSPGGTYTDWYFPGPGYTSLRWAFLPVQDAPPSLTQKGLLHYYAYNFGLVNSTSDVGGGYAGVQTNGYFGGVQRGKVINFSIWGSNAAKSGSPLVGFNTECKCYQIMYKYQWAVNHQLRFNLKRGPSGSDAQGIWWGLWVTDATTNVTKFVGEQRVASVIGGRPATKWSNHTSVFGEDTHWWQTLDGNTKYTNCKGFESSSLAVLNVRANTASPSSMNFFTNSGRISTGANNFETTNCAVIIAINNHHDVQHSLGYWSSKPPYKVPAYPPVSDAGPPTSPYGLEAFATGSTRTSLSWWPATDDVAVVAYDVYRDNVKVATTAGYQLVFRDTGLTPNTTYTYTVVARDIPKTTSSPSDALEVTTSAGP